MALLNIFLIMVTLCLNYFHANSYGLFHPESLGLIAGLYIGLLAFYLAARLLKLEWAFYAMLLLFIVDLTMGAAEVVHEGLSSILSSGLSLWLISYVSLTVPFLIICYILKTKIDLICSAIVLTIFVTTIPFLPSQDVSLYSKKVFNTDQTHHSSRPNILILILDEQIGLQGIPAIVDGGHALKQDLQNLYHRNGFLTYDRAFSNYFQTVPSLSSIFNGEVYDTFITEIGANRILSKLHEEGYGINTYQSTYADFCNPGGVPCENIFTYQQNSIGYLDFTQMGPAEKLWALLDGFIFAYHSWGFKAIRYKFFGERHIKKLAPIATDRVLAELRTDLRVMPNGHVFLVHLLMPHYSYLYDSQCNFRTWDRSGRLDRQRKYQLYFDQVRCLHRKLANLFQYLRDLGLYQSTSIVIMGDHGPRITDKRRPDQAKAEDYLDLFSAFLAVKPGEYNEDFQEVYGNNPKEKTPIVKVVWEYFRMPLTSIATEEFCRVHFQGPTRFLVAQMPDFPSN